MITRMRAVVKCAQGAICLRKEAEYCGLNRFDVNYNSILEGSNMCWALNGR